MTSSEASDTLPLGTIVAGYRLTRVIAEGAFGITYEAESAIDAFKKRVCIKEFFVRGLCVRSGQAVIARPTADPELLTSLRAQFATEARRIVMDYHHPDIVKGENLLEQHGSTFLIMEYVDGPSLKDCLAALPTPFHEEQIQYLLLPVLNVLEYLHRCGDLHRDVSTANILVRQRRFDGSRNWWHGLLIDFGAADQGEQGTNPHKIVRPGFSPPEQYDSSRGPQGPALDLYAFGAVLYSCIAGHPPAEATVRMHAAEYDGAQPGPHVRAIDLPGRRNYSHRFLSAIDRALSLDPDSRPQTASALREALGWGSTYILLPTFPDLDLFPWPDGLPPAASRSPMAPTPPGEPRTVLIRAKEDPTPLFLMMSKRFETPIKTPASFMAEAGRADNTAALDEIARRAPDFGITGFLVDAVNAWDELIDVPFDQDLPALQKLLSQEAFNALRGSWMDRPSHYLRPIDYVVTRVETVTLTQAAVDGDTARITVRLDGDMIGTSRGPDGKPEYHFDRTSLSARHMLTFARDLATDHSPWTVTAIETRRPYFDR